MIKKLALAILILQMSSLVYAQQNYKWRIGGEWVAKDLRPASIYSTAGGGLMIERQWRADSTFKFSAAAGFVHLYGYSTKFTDPFYEVNIPIGYVKGSYMISKTVDLNFSVGGTDMGLFVAPGIGQKWKRFQFNGGYRFAALPFKRGSDYNFKNHITTGILYNFIKN